MICGKVEVVMVLHADEKQWCKWKSTVKVLGYNQDVEKQDGEQW